MYIPRSFRKTVRRLPLAGDERYFTFLVPPNGQSGKLDANPLLVNSVFLTRWLSDRFNV